MQTQINPALAAAMTLERAAQAGEFQPVTPQGQPTVAAQLMQQAMPPAVPDVAQQAGLAAQIQAMQQQRAQQALIQQAMAQQQRPVMAAGGGLMRLQSNIPEYHEGGIVGYSRAGDVQDMPYGPASSIDPEQYAREAEMMNVEGEARRAARERRDDAERLAFLERAAPEVAARLKAQQAQATQGRVLEDIKREEASSAAPPAPPPAAAREREAFTPAQSLGIVAPLFEKQRAEYAKIRTEPLTPEELLAQNQKERQVRRQMMIQSGLDPDYLEKREAQGKALFEQQQALLRERMERERGKDTFLGRMGEALRNFQQLRGEGLGRGFVRADEALSRRVAAGEASMDELKNLELKAMELDMTRRNALEDARHAIATGDFNRAQQSLTAARNAENDKAKLVGGTFGPQATAAVQERQVAATEAARAESVRARSEQSLDAQLSRSIDVLRKTENDIRSKYKDPLERFSTMRAASQGNLPEAMAKEEARLIAQRDSEIRNQTANIRNQIRALETQRFGAPIEPEMKRTASMDDMRTTAAKMGVPVDKVVAQAKAAGYIITGQ